MMNKKLSTVVVKRPAILNMVVIGLLLFGQGSIIISEINSHYKKKMKVIADLLIIPAQDALFGYSDTIERVSIGLLKHDYLDSIIVSDEKGAIIFEKSSITVGEDVARKELKIDLDDIANLDGYSMLSIKGKLTLRYNHSARESVITLTFIGGFLFLFCVIVLFLFYSRHINNIIVKPLVSLNKRLNMFVDSNDLETEISLKSAEEIEQIAETLNTALKVIKQNNETIKEQERDKFILENKRLKENLAKKEALEYYILKMEPYLTNAAEMISSSAKSKGLDELQINILMGNIGASLEEIDSARAYISGSSDITRGIDTIMSFREFDKQIRSGFYAVSEVDRGDIKYSFKIPEDVKHGYTIIPRNLITRFATILFDRSSAVKIGKTALKSVDVILTKKNDFEVGLIAIVTFCATGTQADIVNAYNAYLGSKGTDDDFYSFEEAVNDSLEHESKVKLSRVAFTNYKKTLDLLMLQTTLTHKRNEIIQTIHADLVCSTDYDEIEKIQNKIIKSRRNLNVIQQSGMNETGYTIPEDSGYIINKIEADETFDEIGSTFKDYGTHFLLVSEDSVWIKKALGFLKEMYGNSVSVAILMAKNNSLEKLDELYDDDLPVSILKKQCSPEDINQFLSNKLNDSNLDLLKFMNREDKTGPL